MEDQCLDVLYESDFKNAGKGYSWQRDESEARELSQGLGRGRALGGDCPFWLSPGAFELLSPAITQIRTQDVSYFRDVPGAHGYLARIRPVQPTHRGTFSCVILHDQRPLARLYFFLNGAGGTRM